MVRTATTRTTLGRFVAGITGPLFNPNLKVWADGAFIHAEEDDDGDEIDFWAHRCWREPTRRLLACQFGPEFAWNSHDGDDARS